jgi:hypothetical protein
MSDYGGKPKYEVDLTALEKAAEQVKTQAEIARKLKISTRTLFKILEQTTPRERYERGHQRFLEVQGKRLAS